MDPGHERLLDRLLAHLEDGVGDREATEYFVPTWHYTDEARLRAEREVLFERRPIAIAHGSELREPGAALAFGDLGRPIVVVRGDDGRLRGFLNACRHRGTTLVAGDLPCKKKAFVCPYHGWTYDLAGRLIHVPDRDGFPTLDERTSGLVEVPVTERGGLVWVQATPGGAIDVEGFLGPLGDELDALGLGDHHVHRRTVVTRQCNWKLVIDAFLEAYHLRQLHRDSIYRFFVGNLAVFDRVGVHLRAATARRELLAAATHPRTEWNPRELMTPSYLLFPNTVLVCHPDYVSQLGVFPLATGQVKWVHTMLIPRRPESEDEGAHWTRTHELIDGTVFQREDLTTCEQMDVGLRSGALEELRFGRFEAANHWFHRAIADALADAGTAA